MPRRFIYLFFTLLLLSFTSCDMVKSFFGMPTSEDVENLKKREEAMAAREKYMQDSIARVRAEIEAQQAAELEARREAETTRYHVIAGSFKVPGNAEKMAKMLSAEGYQPEILEFANGFQAVSAFSSESFREANREMEKIKEAAYSPYDIWIHVVNPAAKN